MRIFNQTQTKRMFRGLVIFRACALRGSLPHRCRSLLLVQINNVQPTICQSRQIVIYFSTNIVSSRAEARTFPPR